MYLYTYMYIYIYLYIHTYISIHFHSRMLCQPCKFNFHAHNAKITKTENTRGDCYH